MKGYHFCKECRYRQQGTIRTVKEGKKEYVEFLCYLDAKEDRSKGNLYYKGDFDAYKINCPGWEPYQESLLL